jgi:uncharacterized membrane-anchored protein
MDCRRNRHFSSLLMPYFVVAAVLIAVGCAVLSSDSFVSTRPDAAVAFFQTVTRIGDRIPAAMVSDLCSR